MNNNRWLTISEAAEYINYSIYSIYKFIRLGMLPVIKAGGKAKMQIDKLDLDKFMLRNKISPREIIKDRINRLKQKTKND